MRTTLVSIAVCSVAGFVFQLSLGAPLALGQAVGPCESEDSAAVARWTASAELPPGNYRALACPSLDDVEGPELVVVAVDERGTPRSWLVLRSDPDRVRVAFQRTPSGLRAVEVSGEPGTVTESVREENGDTRISDFSFDGDLYSLDARRFIGTKRAGWTIVPRSGRAGRAGRLELDRATFARAKRVFGKPRRYLVRKRDWCQARFRRGVTVTAITLGLPPSGRCGGSLSVTRVRVSARGWHTTRDLRIGDSRERIASAHPGAEPEEDFEGNEDEDRMVLRTADVGFGTVGTAVAVLSNDRVITFELFWPNAGE